MQECGLIFGTRQTESGKAIRRLSAKLGVVDRLSAEARDPVRRLFSEAGIKAGHVVYGGTWWDMVEMSPVAT